MIIRDVIGMLMDVGSMNDCSLLMFSRISNMVKIIEVVMKLIIQQKSIHKQKQQKNPSNLI